MLRNALKASLAMSLAFSFSAAAQDRPPTADFGQYYGRHAYGKDLRGPYYGSTGENTFFEEGGDLRRQYLDAQSQGDSSPPRQQQNYGASWDLAPTIQGQPLGYVGPVQSQSDPSYGRRHARALDYDGSGPQDARYQQWRDRQLRSMDRDYSSWRANRLLEMDRDYETWRLDQIRRMDQEYANYRGSTGGDPQATGEPGYDAQYYGPMPGYSSGPQAGGRAITGFNEAAGRGGYPYPNYPGRQIGEPSFDMRADPYGEPYGNRALTADERPQLSEQ